MTGSTAQRRRRTIMTREHQPGRGTLVESESDDFARAGTPGKATRVAHEVSASYGVAAIQHVNSAVRAVNHANSVTHPIGAAIASNWFSNPFFVPTAGPTFLQIVNHDERVQK